ncbi:hypothetical protein RB213_006743 [Colletotrichum asianum]
MKLLPTVTTLALLVTDTAAVAIGNDRATRDQKEVELLTRQGVGNLPPWDEWTCYDPGSGGGHSALRKAAAVFNDRWGNPRLEMEKLTCYVSACDGHYFAVCNESGVTKTEVSDARNHAVNADPGNCLGCRYLHFRESYIRYFFGVGEPNFDANYHPMERRDC